MLLANQVNKITVQAQAQERLLVKIIEQNVQTHQSLARVEEATFKISDQLQLGFAQIGTELSKVGNQEGLEELKEIWSSKMEALETLIQEEADTKSMEKLMKKLEMMMDAKLLDLNLDSSMISQQLQQVQQQLTEAAQARERGEQHANEQLKQIVDGMKGLQLQLERVEQQVQRLFQYMDHQFDNIRNQLGSNQQGLNELRQLWMKKLEEIEGSIHTLQQGQETANHMNNPNDFQASLEKQMKKFEAMLTAKLFDLDVENHSMKEQLVMVQKELVEAAKARQQDVVEGDKKIGRASCRERVCIGV
jgi:chromosome segregation ATPase